MQASRRTAAENETPAGRRGENKSPLQLSLDMKLNGTPMHGG